MSAHESAPVASGASRRGPGRLALALTLAGCGYTSQYTPPLDGRARAVWEEDRVVMEVATPSSPECQAALEERLARPWAPDGPRRVQGYWTPRYYGPAIIVATPGLAPNFALAPLFLPHRLLLHGLAHGVGPPAVSVSDPAPALRGGGDGLGKAAVVLAVVALAVLPAVDVGLALSSPEDARASVAAMSEVSAYNDLARLPGSPCGEATGAPVGAP